MPINIGNSGNRTVAVATIGVGGANHTVVNGWIGVGGANHLFYTSFAPVTHTYTSGSGNETVPIGAQSLTIVLGGSGGGGAGGQTVGGNGYRGGGGGGSVISYTIAIAYADWGGTIPYAVGPGGVGGTANNAGTNGTDTTTTGTLTNGSVGVTASGAQGGQLSVGGAYGATSGPGGSTSYAGTWVPTTLWWRRW